MRFRPMNGRVVIHRTAADEITPGGILIPESSQKRSDIGKVVEVCEWWEKDGCVYKSKLGIGDTVLFSKYAGDEFTIAGKFKVLLLKEEDVLSIIDDDEEPQPNEDMNASKFIPIYPETPIVA